MQTALLSLRFGGVSFRSATLRRGWMSLTFGGRQKDELRGRRCINTRRRGRQGWPPAPVVPPLQPKSLVVRSIRLSSTLYILGSLRRQKEHVLNVL